MHIGPHVNKLTPTAICQREGGHRMPKSESNDRRAQRTRASLQSALLTLLKQKPLAKIQIKELTALADVSRQVFYLHFESKEDLLFSYMDDVFAQIHKTLFENVTNVNHLKREMPLVLIFQQWANHAEALNWVMQVENKDLLIERLREHTNFLMEEIADHPGSDVRRSRIHDHVADFLVGGAYMLLKRWLGEGMQQTPEEMGMLTYQLMESLPGDRG